LVLLLTWQVDWHSSWLAAAAVLVHKTSSSSQQRSWAVSRVCCKLMRRLKALLLLQQMK
jgi:hypothetical protein